VHERPPPLFAEGLLHRGLVHPDADDLERQEETGHHRAGAADRTDDHEQEVRQVRGDGEDGERGCPQQRDDGDRHVVLHPEHGGQEGSQPQADRPHRDDHGQRVEGVGENAEEQGHENGRDPAHRTPEQGLPAQPRRGPGPDPEPGEGSPDRHHRPQRDVATEAEERADQDRDDPHPDVCHTCSMGHNRQTGDELLTRGGARAPSARPTMPRVRRGRRRRRRPARRPGW